MRFMAILQIIMGIAVIIFSYAIVTHIDLTDYNDLKSNYENSGELVIDYIPPDPTPEIILSGLGLAITVCGIILAKAKIKLAIFQTIAGLILIIINVILSVIASQTGHLNGVFTLEYISLALGLMVSLTGLYQIVTQVLNKFDKT